jgi:hypothetical protein
MAEGFLGGLSGFGDFLTGGGVYADPKNINPTYGVPEGDVRQAAINQLGQISALLLAAGQPMEGSQRAQILAQMGQAGGQFNTNLYNASQRRLMTAQMQEKQDEMSRIQAMAQKVKDDPEGLAASLRLPVDLVKTIPTKSLIDLATQIQIKRATVEPSQAALTEAFASTAVPAAPMATPVAAETPVAGASAYSSMPIPAGTTPQDSATIRAYQAALNDPRIARDPKQVKAITDALEALMPGVREAGVQRAKRQEELAANRPKAEIAVMSSDEDTRLVTGIVDDAVKSIDEGGRLVAGTIGSRLAGKYEPATNLQSQIDAIRSRIGLGKIQELKAQSATGATGLGSVAVRELDRLEASLGSLDQAQSPDELKKRLLSIKDSLNRYNDSVRQSYKATYGQEYRPPQSTAPAPTTGGPARINSKEEYDALGRGQSFIAPDGTIRRKP